MKYFDTKSAEIIFSVEIEDVGADVISGGYGTVIYKKASVENPAYDFALSGAEVVATNGSVKAHTGVVYDKTTGFFGIVFGSPAVGDRVTFSGAFIKPSSDDRKVGEKSGVKIITDEVSTSKSFTYDASKTPKPINWETTK
jgi:hypothetical protein